MFSLHMNTIRSLAHKTQFILLFHDSKEQGSSPHNPL